MVLISFVGFFQLDTRPEFAEELCGRVVVLTGRRGLLAAWGYPISGDYCWPIRRLISSIASVIIS